MAKNAKIERSQKEFLKALKAKFSNTREEYWKTQIVFDCPIRNIRHTINDCFEKCDMWGKRYKSGEDGRTAAYLFCHAVDGERELHTGERTRDN